VPNLTAVDGRFATVAVAAVAGIGAALSSSSPTGHQPFDAIVLVATIGSATWAAARAPWWAIAATAGIAAAMAYETVGVAVGVAGALAALWRGWDSTTPEPIGVLAVGLALNGLCRMQYDAPFGVTAAIGLAGGCFLAVSGLREHSRATRKVVVGVVLGAGVLAGLAGAGLYAAARSAQADVAVGRDLIERGIRELRDGEYDAAASSFAEAGERFAEVKSAMDRPWAQPARLVPVASHHRRVAGVIGDGAAEASASLAEVARVIDPDALRLVEGRIDLAEIEAVDQPLSRAADALFELRAAIDDVDSGWLLPRYGDQLGEASDEFDEHADQLDVAVELLDVLPALLGDTEERDFFLAFITPAEARGSGGFMGNYAILTTSNGAVEMTEFGRTRELNDAVEMGTRLDLPTDWERRWGRYGFTNGFDGTVGINPWSNVTLSPDFPSTGAVIADLWEASGGDPIDGVISIDPFVLEALIELTGSLDVGVGTSWERRLTGDNTADFLLFDQYLIPETSDRIDLLEDVTSQVVSGVLEGSLPNPTRLADRLGPLVDAQRLNVWMADPDEQDFFDRVDADGGMPPVAGTDGIHVAINNAGANKLDAFLDRSISYRASYDPASAFVRGTIDITLRNTAPAEGLPDGVIGNYVGDPIGTNRMFVTVYTGVRASGALIDGVRIGMEPASEAGWTSAMVPVVIPSGEERTLTIEIEGQLVVTLDDGTTLAAADHYEFVLGTQPLVDDVEFAVDVRTVDGKPLVQVDDVLVGWHRWVFDSDEEVIDD
jgi:hypothetical protein